MKKRNIISLIGIVLSMSTFLNAVHGQGFNYKGDTLMEKSKILYILRTTKETPLISENLIISPSDVDSLSDLPYVNYKEFLKLMQVATIWIILPKPNVKFIGINELFNIFNISKNNQSLAVRIDNWIVDHPERIIAEKSEILKLTIVKAPGYHFINIITKHPLEPPPKLGPLGIKFR